MNVTTDAVEPPHTSTVGEPSRSSHDYLFVVGFFFTVLLLFTITYVAYTSCKKRSPPPPPPPDIISFGTTTYDITLSQSQGIDDDVLETFPVFVYSDITVTQNGDTASAKSTTSGCSICLGDYRAADVVRLLPECGHLFHVSCIDTWLKAHPSCPVCRNSPLAGILPVRPVSINLTN